MRRPWSHADRPDGQVFAKSVQSVALGHIRARRRFPAARCARLDRWPSVAFGVAESLYVPLGDDQWLATVRTTGPWDAGAQHGGPPSALLGRAIWRCQPGDEMMIARFTCEILGAIPVGEISRPRPGWCARAAASSCSRRPAARAGARSRGPARGGCCGRAVARCPPPPPRPRAPPDRAGRAAARGRGGRIPVGDRVADDAGGFPEPGPAPMWGRMRYPVARRAAGPARNGC